MNSRDKGKRGELECRDFLRERGFTAERGQQHAGGADSQDVKHNVPGTHIEVKRVEAGSPYRWLKQAIRDAGEGGNTPVVFHRRNGQEWIVVMRADDFLRLKQQELW